MKAAADRISGKKPVVLLKISPDLIESEKKEIAKVLLLWLSHGFRCLLSRNDLKKMLGCGKNEVLLCLSLRLCCFQFLQWFPFNLR